MPTKGKIRFLLCLLILAVIAVATVRLTINTDAANSDSNEQLKSRALGLVKKIRELVDSYNKEDQKLMTDYQANYLATRTTEREAIRDRYVKKSSEVNDSTVRAYKEKLLAESKGIRAELHRRLPKNLYRPNLSKIYENPSMVMEISIIADDLELLSKSLSDR
jgi:hypothetical protein